MYRHEKNQVRPPPEEEARLSTTVVLLVEDDAPLRRVLAETLEIYGYEVIAAACTETAVETLENEHVTVVVSDLHLQGNGLSVLAASRVTETEIPVILISADTSPATSRRADELGASRFLVKPVTGQELHDAIQAVHPGPTEARS